MAGRACGEKASEGFPDWGLLLRSTGVLGPQSQRKVRSSCENEWVGAQLELISTRTDHGDDPH